MRRRGAAACLLAAVLCLAVPATAQDACALLHGRTQAFSDAVQQGDASTLQALLDDTVVFVAENGQPGGKADIVGSVPPSPPASPAAASSAVKMAVTDWQCALHDSVAVTSFIDDQTKDLGGQTFHAQYRSVETWLRVAETWRMIASQTMTLAIDPPTVVLPPAELDEYAGTHVATPRLQATFAHTGADLTLSTNGGAPVVQRAELRDVVFTPGLPRLRRIFQRDARGHVSGFISRRDGHDIVFRRTALG